MYDSYSSVFFRKIKSTREALCHHAVSNRAKSYLHPKQESGENREAEVLVQWLSCLNRLNHFYVLKETSFVSLNKIDLWIITGKFLCSRCPSWKWTEKNNNVWSFFFLLLTHVTWCIDFTVIYKFANSNFH